jgi:hypothetical protein
LTIPNVSGTIITSAGGTFTGPVTSSYSSSTWINSANGKSAFNLTGTGYTGWISGPCKDGRLVISSYPGSNNRLYFGYMSKTAIDAGTNTLNYTMSWEGSSGTYLLINLPCPQEILVRQHGNIILRRIVLSCRGTN